MVHRDLDVADGNYTGALIRRITFSRVMLEREQPDVLSPPMPPPGPAVTHAPMHGGSSGGTRYPSAIASKRGVQPPTMLFSTPVDK